MDTPQSGVSRLSRRQFKLRVATGLTGVAIASSFLTSPERPADAAIPQRYRIADVGTLRTDGEGTSTALGINANGFVVGVADADGGTRVGFRWDQAGGRLNFRTNSVTLGGSHSTGWGINDGLQIAGEANTADVPSQFSHAFFFGPGMVDLNGQGPFNGGQNSRAVAINNSGIACGAAQIQGGQFRPFRYSSSTGVQALPTLGGGGRANAINAAGRIVGLADVPNGTHAAIWSGPSEPTSFIILTFTRSVLSEAFGINDAGLVVGARKVSGAWGAYLFRPTTNRASPLATLSGTRESWAFDINNRSQVVGMAQARSATTRRAVIWEGNRVVDLNSRLPNNSGWRLIRAVALNDAGQIVGEGIRLGRLRGFVLTPQ